MKSCADLLAKYQNLKPTDSIKKEAAIEVINKLFDLKLEKKELSIGNNIIRINSSTKLKSEVFIHKAEIMRSLREILGKECPKDIK
ncbi:MAG: hypothetical protein NTY66_02505 [Candidatus Vogelbacteria bacterium]|nr:hypothetical protein [Candidatus Vogelbacteria bacterium]